MDSNDIQAASEKAKASLRAAKDKTSAETSQAMNASQGLADQVSGAASDLYGRAKDHVQGLSDKMPDSAADAYETGYRTVAQGADSVGRQVAKQPIEALLLAGAIGYLVGWATSRS